MRVKLFPIALAALVCLVCCEEKVTPPDPEPEPEPAPTPSFIPPKEHPRLYLRGQDIPALKTKCASEQGKEIIDKLKALSVPRTPEEEAAVTDHGYRYYYEMRGLTSEIQLLALDYLTEGDTASADKAISSALDTLKKTNFGTANDLSRASGVMLMVGAMVYDWCYDRISLLDKTQFIKEFKRIAGTMECGYPPSGKDYIVGHASEWMILRDLLSAGVAVYDEDPEIYGYVSSLILDKYVPVRNYTYAGGNYHQGTNYAEVRFGNDLISMWIFASMGLGNIYSSDIRDVAYDLVYRYRPDGQVLPSGDNNPNRRANWKCYPLIGMLSGSYFSDPYLEYLYDFKPEIENHCLMLELLWRDFNLKSQKADDLPLTRYSPSPFGWMIARTGWGDDAAIVEMKVGEQYYGNHQHLDAGAFQVYYKGPLAIDSGTYQGSSGDYGSEHCKNYFKRTIAHNSLLIYNPAETFDCSSYGGSPKTTRAANDGGQRMPKSWKSCESLDDLQSAEYTTGKVLAQWTDGRNAYLKGDITSAYSSKVSCVQRSFFFVNNDNTARPATLVVFDRVVSSDSTFKKYFLLHSIEEPVIENNTYTVRRTLNGDSGLLHCTALLPEDATLRTVGGEGYEFWVFGKNYPNDRYDPANERGAWRVEVCPGNSRREDSFLNVLEIAQGGTTTFGDATLIRSGNAAGCSCAGATVLFSLNGEALDERISFSVPSESSHAYVCDLKPGNWVLFSPNGTYTTVQVGEDRMLRSEVSAGEYQIWRMK